MSEAQARHGDSHGRAPFANKPVCDQGADGDEGCATPPNGHYQVHDVELPELIHTAEEGKTEPDDD